MTRPLRRPLPGWRRLGVRHGRDVARNGSRTAPRPRCSTRSGRSCASEQGVSAGDVKVISAQAVNWPNGALGCPKPGRMYTQAIVPGYRIELEAGGKRFTYHAATRGGYKRCRQRARAR